MGLLRFAMLVHSMFDCFSLFHVVSGCFKLFRWSWVYLKSPGCVGSFRFVVMFQVVSMVGNCSTLF